MFTQSDPKAKITTIYDMVISHEITPIIGLNVNSICAKMKDFYTVI